ncbi:MAG: hypothetical protein QG551_22 [Patescibacteria group bacterium]|nr:hypothetical protein [Patescibacteria group bacterium]
MSFFDKIFEKPRFDKPDKLEEGDDNLKKIRSIKKEHGDSHVEKVINEKIEKGETQGEYKLDERYVELERLGSEYEELRENPKVQEYLLESFNMMELQKEREELEQYLQRVLLNSDSEETDYDEKVLQLAANKKDQEYKTRKIEEMDQETIDLVDKLKEIEDKMEKIDSDLKKTYGNTNLKNDRGDYLN